MTLTHWRDRLDALGPDIANWPTVERGAAQALLSTSAEARTMLRDAETLETALAQNLAPPPVSLATLTRLKAIAESRATGTASWRQGFGDVFAAWATPWRAGLVASLAAGALGFAVGTTGLTPLVQDNDHTTAELVAMAYGAELADLQFEELAP